MAKIPYLRRRNNIYYFRVRIPAEYLDSLNAREIVQSHRTENRAVAIPQALKLAAHFKAALHDLKTGKAQEINQFVIPENGNNAPIAQPIQEKLPVFLDLISDKPINRILQADINAYFDDAQKLPVRRDAKNFERM